MTKQLDKVRSRQHHYRFWLRYLTAQQRQLQRRRHFRPQTGAPSAYLLSGKRRRVLLMLLLVGLLGLFSAAPAAANREKVPANTPIEHFIFLMQENHSFDNYFGTYPGAEGIPPGTCIPVDPFDEENTDCVEPYHIGELDVEMDDPDHSDATHRLQYNEGRMDGFVYALNQRGQDGRLAMGYYDGTDLPFHWNVADNYVLFDHFFSSASGGSFVNHMFWVAAAPGQEPGRNTQEVLAETPTIFDRLDEAGVTWKFYVQNYEPALTYRTMDQFPGNRASQVIWVPLLNFDRYLDDPLLNNRIVDLNEYFEDLVSGELPQVAFVVPSGPSEHPPSSLASGQRFVKTLIQSLMQSDYWEKSAFLWAYDDWGGWYDHVPPPQVDEYGYGFRVPALLVSAYAKKGYIDSTVLDYTSALRFIEDNWDIEPLTERDANANSIAGAFDFDSPPRTPRFLPYEREVLEEKPEPRRAVIYGAYGTAILFGVALIAVAILRPENGLPLPPSPQQTAEWARQQWILRRLNDDDESDKDKDAPAEEVKR